MDLSYIAAVVVGWVVVSVPFSVAIGSFISMDAKKQQERVPAGAPMRIDQAA